MRNATPTQAVEMLLRALFEGTASDGPWVEHNGIACEMEELAYNEPLDMLVPYQYLLLTLASDETRAVTRQSAQAVRAAADRLMATTSSSSWISAASWIGRTGNFFLAMILLSRISIRPRGQHLLGP